VIELLTLGGLVTGLAAWGFWAVALVVLGVFIALTEGEHWGWATTLFVGVFASLWMFGIFNIWNYAVRHPASLAYWFGSYIGIGMVWGAIKWYFYCVKQRKRYEEAKADFLEANHATELTPELRVAWTEKLTHQSGYERYHLISIKVPEAKDNKEKIMNWMYLWPFSMFGTLLYDFIRDFFTWLYDRMGKVYDNIAKMVWKGVEEDLASETDIQAAREAALLAAGQQNPARTRTAGR
jgi:hypothetical protein